MRRRSVWIKALLIVLILVALGWKAIAEIAVEQMWYADLGYLGIFWTRVGARIATGAAAAAAVFVFLLINLAAAKLTVRAIAPWLVAIVAAVPAVVAGVAASDSWMVFQQYLKAVPFGRADPLFGRDVAFYVFKLPLLKQLHWASVIVVGLTLIAVSAIYLVSGSIIRFHKDHVVDGEGRSHVRIVRGGIDSKARLHMAILAALLCLVIGAGYHLAAYNLVYSTRGLVLGASYADAHATLPGLRVMTAVAIIVAALILIAAVTKNRTRALRIGVCAAGILAVGSLLAIGVFPGLIQQFYVGPNELEAEKKYIQYNIDSTRAAFGLDGIEEHELTIENGLTAADLAAAGPTISNIRLWDWEPLLDTYGQLQEMRLYYRFADVDIDRYLIDGAQTQVMLAARELDVDRLPVQAQTWANRHLNYTHGYGVCASPVNEIGADGLPTFVLRDIPPKGEGELQITRPQIYFGELTKDWVIANTKSEEFDYPVGDSNAYGRYSADSGIRVGSYLKRALLASKFSDMKILLSSDLRPDSRLLYDREITGRVKKIAPFLTYEYDPYVVVDDGRLVWVIDAYTTSRAYPFAERYRKGINYVRNSVKATVDAYTGEVSFYIIDPGDPLAATYARVFPGLFKPASEMPEGVKSHMRYPEELFTAQAAMYSLYHMKDPTVFYNKEDYWDFPSEIYKGEKREVAPYYVNMALPGEDDVSYVLMMPFTPSRKDNMVAWLAASSDMDDYGRMGVYKFTKQRVIYGPMQVEAQIDQDGEISKLLSLWNQKGSSVIRGNLLVFPIGRGVLYVESIFLAAQSSQLPQLKRVVVSDGTRLAMGEDLGSALAAMLRLDNGRGGSSTVEGGYGLGVGASMGHGEEPSLSDQAKRALDLFNKGRERLREADWQGFGATEKELEAVLRSMAGEGR